MKNGLIWVLNDGLSLFLNLLVFSIVILAITMAINCLIILIRPKIRENTNFYLYSFSTGLLVIIGTVGLLSEGYSNAQAAYPHDSLLAVTILLCGGLAGFIFTVVLRFFLATKISPKHLHHELHDHSDHIINATDIDNPKAAWLVIGLLLAHRSIDGFMLGSIIPKLMAHKPLNLGFMIVFFIHIIFEVVFIYYRQIQYGQKKWKALLHNFYTLVALVVIIFVGGFLYDSVEKVGWIIPFANGFGGIIITFVTILEIVPEFIHFRNINAKKWYVTIIWFGIGLLFALAMVLYERNGS